MPNDSAPWMRGFRLSLSRLTFTDVAPLVDLANAKGPASRPLREDDAACLMPPEYEATRMAAAFEEMHARLKVPVVGDIGCRHDAMPPAWTFMC